MEIPRNLVLAAVLVFAFASAFFLCSCTPTWTQDTAQRALTSGAEVVQALDEQVAPIMQTAIEQADQEHSDREGFLASIEPWSHVASAMMVTRRSFLAAQRGLDVWRLGNANQWLDASVCLLAGLLELETMLPTVGVEVPSEVHQWVVLFQGFAVGSCTARE